MGHMVPVLSFVETSVLCHHVQTFAWPEISTACESTCRRNDTQNSGENQGKS
jgi:hypothetical protein